MSGVKRPVGRPSKFTQSLSNKICEQIAQGKSLRMICADKNMPTHSTVHKWLNDVLEFSEQYVRAREEQADFFADEIIEIADSTVPDSAEVAKAKLQIDARKWKASKMAPKKYGEKLEQSIRADLDISINKPLSALFEKDA